MQVIKWDETNKPSDIKINNIINFLYENLEEYGDTKEDIRKCLKYVFNELSERTTSGFIIEALENSEIIGISVINETGMSGYIPENILVYIATCKKNRGKGIGKLLMLKIIEETKGNIALHVENDNPAKYLYEKLGFTNKYLEMRLEK
ncbi:N-acetyltransferase [Paenimyroides tangerinum]|uniref:N-acetyltransferase n=1 Tax=Paenimyroides tangerinum TaxID=2488728 RepID=A0A3P3VY84_9FLAO|nr:GNAT family N-acetyltransferase [Paenimyroides tangerinum]RRJ87660.1 N-acetyltransferase [Paenimyroides tangerinum]